MKLNSIEDEKEFRLIRDWIEYQKLYSKGVHREELFWAWEEMDMLCESKPFRAFEMIIKIASATDDEYILSNLAAGHLEDLLVRNGEIVLEEIEKKVIETNVLLELLSGVWQNSINKEVWERLEILRSNDINTTSR